MCGVVRQKKAEGRGKLYQNPALQNISYHVYFTVIPVRDTYICVSVNDLLSYSLCPNTY